MTLLSTNALIAKSNPTLVCGACSYAFTLHRPFLVSDMHWAPNGWFVGFLLHSSTEADLRHFVAYRCGPDDRYNCIYCIECNTFRYANSSVMQRCQCG